MTAAWTTGFIRVPVAGETVDLCFGERPGSGTPVLYLHGLGSTMRDFEGAPGHPAFAGRRLLAFDFPGCGRSGYPERARLSVDDLIDVTRAVLRLVAADPVALVGHSMGGYVGLRYAVMHTRRVERFVNVEGNLSPEDCAIISRDASVVAAAISRAAVHADMVQRLRADADVERRWYAECVAANVRPEAFVDYCTSLVAATDRLPLLQWMCSLAIPRTFIHGSANGALSYLPVLERAGVTIAQIGNSGHFPMQSNQREFFLKLGHALGIELRIGTARRGVRRP